MNNVIIRAVVTEKSLRLAEQGQYTFIVHPDADKHSVAAAAKRLYAVEPIMVHTFNLPGKEKRRGKITGTRSDIYKAIVTLKPGQKIAEFSVGE